MKGKVTEESKRFWRWKKALIQGEMLRQTVNSASNSVTCSYA